MFIKGRTFSVYIIIITVLGAALFLLWYFLEKSHNSEKYNKNWYSAFFNR